MNYMTVFGVAIRKSWQAIGMNNIVSGDSMNASPKMKIPGLEAAKKKYRLMYERIRLKFGPERDNFVCPACEYEGPFIDVFETSGFRKNAQCPKCGAFERHRLQFLTLEKLAGLCDFPEMAMLHIGPDLFFRKKFKKTFKSYTHAEIVVKSRVGLKARSANLPFDKASFDFIFASEVFEFLKDEARALEEIRRVIRPGGVAVLPVPILAEDTIEYPKANPHEFGYVRAPGMDFYDRYRKWFSTVDSYESWYFPEKYQTCLCENRRNWPTESMPLRRPMSGTKHPETVPVCFV